MNKRGFTLVELLAVVLVIALIATFALPQVLNQFSNNENELSQKQIEMIEEAGMTFVQLYNDDYAGKSSCVRLSRLVDADLLNEGFVINALGSDYNNQKSLKVVSNNNKYTVTLVNGTTCGL